MNIITASLTNFGKKYAIDSLSELSKNVEGLLVTGISEEVNEKLTKIIAGIDAQFSLENLDSGTEYKDVIPEPEFSKYNTYQNYLDNRSLSKNNKLRKLGRSFSSFGQNNKQKVKSSEMNRSTEEPIYVEGLKSIKKHNEQKRSEEK